MPGYRGTGTEDLGSNPKALTSPPATQDRSPGKDAGGTANLRAYQATLAAKMLKSPTGGPNRIPAQSFTDDKV